MLLGEEFRKATSDGKEAVLFTAAGDVMFMVIAKRNKTKQNKTKQRSNGEAEAATTRLKHHKGISQSLLRCEEAARQVVASRSRVSEDRHLRPLDLAHHDHDQLYTQTDRRSLTGCCPILELVDITSRSLSANSFLLHNKNGQKGKGRTISSFKSCQQPKQKKKPLWKCNKTLEAKKRQGSHQYQAQPFRKCLLRPLCRSYADVNAMQKFPETDCRNFATSDEPTVQPVITYRIPFSKGPSLFCPQNYRSKPCRTLIAFHVNTPSEAQSMGVFGAHAHTNADSICDIGSRS